MVPRNTKKVAVPLCCRYIGAGARYSADGIAWRNIGLTGAAMAVCEAMPVLAVMPLVCNITALERETTTA